MLCLFFRYAQECSICDNWLCRPDSQSMGMPLGTEFVLSDIDNLLLHHCALKTYKPPRPYVGRIIVVSTVAYSACFYVNLHPPLSPCSAVILAVWNFSLFLNSILCNFTEIRGGVTSVYELYIIPWYIWEIFIYNQSMCVYQRCQ